jgi:hypothetical protein
MSSRILLTALCLATFAGLLGGCGLLKKKTDEAAPSATAAAASAAPVAPYAPAASAAAEVAPVAAAAPAADDAAVPAPQDFEDEAFEKVTPANFKAQLTQLTKDVAAK